VGNPYLVLVLVLAAAIASPCTAGASGGGEKKHQNRASTAKKESKSTEFLERLANEPSRPKSSTTVEAAPGRGVTFSVGDEFSMRLLNTIQPGWFYVARDSGADTSTFQILRARTAVSGHVWDDSKTYLVQFDWARQKVLFDAWFNWSYWESEDEANVLGFRVGQQKPHFGREFQGSFAGLEQTTLGGATTAFTGFRVLGAYLHGDHLSGHELHWWVGAVNDDPAFASSAAEGGQNGAPNVDDRMNYVFDLRFDPAGDFGDEAYVETDLDHSQEIRGTVGAGAMLGGFRAGSATGPEVTTESWHGYTEWKYEAFDALGEVFGRRDDQRGGPAADSIGWQVGGSYATLPLTEGGGQLGLAARVSVVDLRDDPVLLTNTALAAQAGTITDLDSTLSYYVHGHRLKVQLGYRYRSTDPDVGVSSHDSLVSLLMTVRF